MICPSAITLSGAPTGVGHVNVAPLIVACPPEVSAVGVPAARAGFE
jgi:hypothetical protein